MQEMSRDCDAVQIPSGAAVVLPRGTMADITQTLGGSITIRVQGALYRVSAKDADALGLDPIEPEIGGATPAGEGDGLDEGQVWAVLKTCFDPEIPVNIVDLGLVYDLVLDGDPAAGARVKVKMTLTAPGCGMGPAIAGDARDKILALPGVAEAEVEVVWDPPWHQSMITAEGRRVLGL